MEMYIEQGETRMDCELKIAEKYKRPFHILSQKNVRMGGIWGFFSKPGVQVEFYFPSNRSLASSMQHGLHMSAGNSAASFVGSSASLSANQLEEEKKKVLAAASGARQMHQNDALSGREASQQILDALKEIKEKVEKTSNAKEKQDNDHPSFTQAAKILKNNDFSEGYIELMIERLRKEMSFEQLNNFTDVQDKLLEWIGESISIYKEETLQKPGIMVLVGPTGVGKTTTISKLAAIYGLGTDIIPAIDVRMITIDDFRICAKEQLEKIGNIMQIPVTYADSKQQLKKEIAIHNEYTDLFLIDTIGKSPKDSSKIGEMKEILEGVGKNADFHLVMSAATKTKDIEEIMRQFEPFNYKSVIITKMDETDSVGNIISALAEKRKSISFITDGQNLPEDIRRASVVRFLINLEGFKIDREKIENRFPSGEADQFKWR